MAAAAATTRRASTRTKAASELRQQLDRRGDLGGDHEAAHDLVLLRPQLAGEGQGVAHGLGRGHRQRHLDHHRRAGLDQAAAELDLGLGGLGAVGGERVLQALEPHRTLGAVDDLDVDDHVAIRGRRFLDGEHVELGLLRGAATGAAEGEGRGDECGGKM